MVLKVESEKLDEEERVPIGRTIVQWKEQKALSQCRRRQSARKETAN